MKFIEMFCGIGGFRLGLEQTNFSSEKLQAQGEGWNGNERALPDRHSSRSSQRGNQSWNQYAFSCVWSNDIDRYACQVYRRNFGDKELLEGDIRSVDPSALPDFELLTAGFPCPSFSLAGKRRGFEDTRGTLFFEVARFAEAKRPRLLLLENVKGLLSNDDGRTFLKIVQVLDELGYDVEWQVLNSRHFGVPQNRERVFIVGHLRGEGGGQVFPVGKTSDQPQRTCEAPQGEGSRLRVANPLDVGGSFGERNFIANTLSHRYGKDGSENLVLQQFGFSGEDGKGRGFREYRNIVPALTQLMGTGGNNVPMVVAKASVNETPKSNIRRLTPVECERLQGFPDGWTGSVSDSQRYKLLGNAVTVNVIRYLGEKLIEEKL